MTNPEVSPEREIAAKAAAGKAVAAGGEGRTFGLSKGFLWAFAPAAALLIGAIALRFGIGPALELLPTDYSSEIALEADIHFRETTDADTTQSYQKGRRNDQVMSVTDDVAIIQSHIDWSTEEGQVSYETTGLYGVDRRTRRNVPGYGDLSRNSQFLFPPHLGGIIDQVWDPYYSGPRRLTFDRTENVAGLALAVYRFDVAGLDETTAYDFLPEVPEHYRVTTEGAGWLWIEPISGTLVDFVDRGHSYFVDPATGRSAGDFNVWDAHYTAQSKAALLERASAARLRILFIGTWLPLGLSVLALVWLAGNLLRRRRHNAPLAS